MATETNHRGSAVVSNVAKDMREARSALVKLAPKDRDAIIRLIADDSTETELSTLRAEVERLRLVHVAAQRVIRTWKTMERGTYELSLPLGILREEVEALDALEKEKEK